MNIPEASKRSSSLSRFTREVGTAAGWGFVVGALIGGIGGRLAMFLLRLTSSEFVVGMDTDDGFRIGKFTGQTVFLVGATAVLGSIVGVAYLLLRRFLPEVARSWWSALFFGLVGGSLIVEPGDVDFEFLDPLWLAIALFILLPAAYGWTLSKLVERFIDNDVGAFWSKARLAPLLVLVIVGPVGAIMALVGLGTWWVSDRFPKTHGWWRSSRVTWLGRAALVLVGFLAFLDLVGDTREII